LRPRQHPSLHELGHSRERRDDGQQFTRFDWLGYVHLEAGLKRASAI
jgi:hypothetical protein